MLAGGLAAMAPTVAQAGEPPLSSEGSWAKARVVLMPRAGLPDAELQKIVKPHGGKASAIGKSGLYVVELPSNASETGVAQQLKRNPHLKFAELDRRVQVTFAPNDPYVGSEWHLQKIGASTAWDTTQGAGVTIAILDTGVDGSHPDLANRMVAGWNFYDNNSNTADTLGHGTAVAGAAAATANNSIGVAGVAGQARIMPLRISDPSGFAYASTVAKALTYAADNGARVANISFDGMAGNATVQSAAQYMKSKGGLVVVAAGNHGVNEGIGATSSLIPVSATDDNDQLTSWSSYGNFVALSAPGLNIWTTAQGGSYWQCWGTSFASPIAAGVAALVMSAKPTLSNTQVENLLYSTATDLGAPGRDASFGYGRVNAAAAVQAAGGSVAPDTTPPDVSISAPLGGASVSGVTNVDVASTDNVGVTRVELRVNGALVAVDSSAPFAFAWDTSSLPNGTVTVVATAFDAAGNSRASTPVAVNVANVVAPPPPPPPSTTTTPVVDSTPPVVSITNPISGTSVQGKVRVTVNASDDGGSVGLQHELYIDGVLKATGTGSSLTYNWNTRSAGTGYHTIEAVVKDASGNRGTKSEQVKK
jgi:subtilisin family serine protease